MRRRAGVWAILLTVALAATGGAPTAPAFAAVAAAGGTTVTSEGGAVTITVRFDLCCAADAAEQTIYGSLIKEEVAQAEAGWNAALAKLPYHDCFPIKVVFQARLLNRGEKPDPLAHQIGIDLMRPGRPVVFDPGTTDHTDDTTTVYTQTVGGDFFEPAMSARTWEHEIGHLMGLGDDYRDNVLGGHGISQPTKGRAGTLMDTGNSIDQALAQRLGDIAVHSGLKLPKCWTGYADLNVFFAPGCGMKAHVTLALAVTPGGAVTGTSRGDAYYSWCGAGGGQSLDANIPVTGHFTDRGFELKQLVRAPDIGLPVTVPLVSPSEARAGDTHDDNGRRTYSVTLSRG